MLYYIDNNAQLTFFSFLSFFVKSGRSETREAGDRLKFPFVAFRKNFICYALLHERLMSRRTHACIGTRRIDASVLMHAHCSAEHPRARERSENGALCRKQEGYDPSSAITPAIFKNMSKYDLFTFDKYIPFSANIRVF